MERGRDRKKTPEWNSIGDGSLSPDVARTVAAAAKTAGRRARELGIAPDVAFGLLREGLELTPTEFWLLHALAAERGRVVTRDELLQRLWGRRQTRRDRTVDVFVRKLREKVDARAPRHTFLQTRYGVGYKLEPIPKVSTAGEKEREPSVTDGSHSTESTDRSTL